jgi:sugar lactone lactonase YvrE
MPLSRALLAVAAPCLAAALGAQTAEGVASGFRFLEGPAWNARTGTLLFSDIPANTIHALRADGTVEVFLAPSGGANGLVFDADGNLYACQGGARQVVRIAPDGARTVLAERFAGRRLNSPNDLALDDAGGLYFTDPRYGDSADVELDVMGVYYIDANGALARVIDTLPRPNGILVARDGSGLYVANPDARALHYWPILAPGKLGRGRVLFTGDAERDGGGPDGMALDERGRIYATYAGIVVLEPDGTLVQRIAVPERPANCTFGGADGKTLFVTARTGLYRVAMDVRGHLPRAAEPLRAESAPPKLERVTLDAHVGIGYGVAVADVDGDGKADVLLADRDRIAWYRNPTWEQHTIAGRLTRRDHVCLAAADLDGDGRCELAAGGDWDPADTEHSGSVHVLLAGEDRAQPWEARALPHEPTVHRMRWAKVGGGASLIVAPLHPRKGARGVRLLEYRRPDEPGADWPSTPVDDTLHATHNFDVVQWDDDADDELLVAAQEGVFLFDRGDDGWQRTALMSDADGDGEFRGASEVRAGTLPGGARFLVTVEPFHGHQIVVYVAPEPGAPRATWRRRVLDATLAQAHALACGDLLGLGSDQIVAGWRNPDRDGKVGLRLYAPRDAGGRHWQAIALDDAIACEDLCLHDLDGDGRLDVVAAGRASRDLVVWFHRGR